MAVMEEILRLIEWIIGEDKRFIAKKLLTGERVILMRVAESDSKVVL
jgi:hypothetical protein